MPATVKDFDALIAFKHSAYSESVRRWGARRGGAVLAPPNADGAK